MPWPCAGSGADSWDCLSGGGCFSASASSDIPGAGCRGGAEPRYRCHGFPGVPSASLAGGTGDAERGCGDRASGICGCSASVTPAGPQLILSLQLPNRSGFCRLVFIYFFLFILLFSPRAQEQHTISETHTEFFPPAPVELRGPPQLCTATSRAVPSSSSSTSVGTATRFWLVTPPCCGQGSGQGQRHLCWCKFPWHFQLSTSACPPPREGLFLSLQSPSSRSVWLWICGFLGWHCFTQVGVLKTAVPGQPA